MELDIGHGRPLHGRPQPRPFFFMEQPKWMHTTFLLLSMPSILSKTNSNLWILQDFIFQLNSDFFSNSNLNPSRLLLHLYISLGAPTPGIPVAISPQNQNLATTQVPPHHRCLLSPPPQFLKLSLQIKPYADHEEPKT
jgi:hypothetical protein